MADADSQGRGGIPGCPANGGIVPVCQGCSERLSRPEKIQLAGPHVQPSERTIPRVRVQLFIVSVTAHGCACAGIPEIAKYSSCKRVPQFQSCWQHCDCFGLSLRPSIARQIGYSTGSLVCILMWRSWGTVAPMTLSSNAIARIVITIIPARPGRAGVL